MKFFYSYIKEMQLAAKSFYFYIELGMAVVLLIIVLFVVPKNFSKTQKQFLFIDLPAPMVQMMVAGMSSSPDLQAEDVVLKSKGQKLSVKLFQGKGKKLYLAESREDLISLAESQRQPGVVVSLADGQLVYDYYMQGYESQKVVNLIKAAHAQGGGFMDLKQAVAPQIEVKSLETEGVILSDRENLVPVFLFLNGCIMGMFIIASYIFLDKGEGIIKAYAITASHIWVYLASKIAVLQTTTLFTSLLLVIPVFGLKVNYLMLILILLASSLFISLIGLIVASFYQNILKAFGILFGLIILFMLPALAYMIPSWDPLWIRYLPTYPMVESFKEIVVRGDMLYVGLASLGYLGASILLFVFANFRYRKTLAV
ncbi:MAG: ABC transporter permease [Spirochaetales bacterium]|nr:ABC transporter permease [Spirochaetales bacterium]